MATAQTGAISTESTNSRTALATSRGVPPYARGDHMSVMYQHVQGKARPPRDINPGLPPGLPEVIMQAMSVDKDKRFQTMPLLRDALEKFR